MVIEEINPWGREGRPLLAVHGRFFLHASRALATGHLPDVEMPWCRNIEYRGPTLYIHLAYSKINGCVLSISAGSQKILATTERKFEPLPTRLRYWRRKVREYRTDTPLDFRSQVILHALLHGWRRPLRKDGNFNVKPMI